MKFYIIILVAGMLLTGSINTIVKRAQNEASAKGIDGKDRQFEHPWFQTWVMFIGEFLCLGGLFVQRYLEYRRRKQADAKSFQYGPINDEVEVPPLTPKPRIFQWVLILPTLFDLAGTTLAGIGLLWIYASVWQMLRGSIIVFTGILSVIFLKRKLSAYHWLGMAIVVLGLALVGTASILGESGSKGYKMYLGIGLILLGQLCSAGQMVVEETFVKGRALPPLQIVGLEGFFGLVIMTVVFLPVIYFIPGSQPSHFSHGSYENTLDAFVQLGNSWFLLATTFGYLISIAFYNFFGLAVTKSLTAVHRTLIDACRTIIVWVVGLFLYYAVDLHDIGEAWTKWSGLQVAGFVLLFLGTLIYNAVVKLPFFRYEKPKMAEVIKVAVQDSETEPLIDDSTSSMWSDELPTSLRRMKNEEWVEEDTGMKRE